MSKQEREWVFAEAKPYRLTFEKTDIEFSMDKVEKVMTGAGVPVEDIGASTSFQLDCWVFNQFSVKIDYIHLWRWPDVMMLDISRSEAEGCNFWFRANYQSVATDVANEIGLPRRVAFERYLTQAGVTDGFDETPEDLNSQFKSSPSQERDNYINFIIESGEFLVAEDLLGRMMQVGQAELRPAEKAVELLNLLRLWRDLKPNQCFPSINKNGFLEIGKSTEMDESIFKSLLIGVSKEGLVKF